MCHPVLKPNLNGIIMFAWRCASVNFAVSSNGRSFKNVMNNSLEIVKKYSNNVDKSNILNSVKDIQRHWLSRFDENNIPDSETSIRFIIEHALGFKQSYEYELNLQRQVTEDEKNKIDTLCECRLARMPVQYIIKEWDFRDLRLEMCPPVFIPRPETEELVDLIIKRVPKESVILEIGCGSGAISLSILKALPKTQVIAVDQSKLACALTMKNAEINGLTQNLKVINSKLKEDGNLSHHLPVDQVDVLVSNPPYVPTAQMLDLQPEIKIYEDLRALEAGPDGLRVVKALFLLAKTIVKPGGLIFLEVDSTHPKLIKNWIDDNPECKIKFIKSYKDFCDNDRFVKLKMINSQ